jgi:hypothetical protein
MTLRHVVIACGLAACIQSAGAVHDDSAGTGTVVAILDFCIKVNDENAAKFRAFEKLVKNGGSQSGASKSAYDQTTIGLQKLNKKDVATACANAAKSWN